MASARRFRIDQDCCGRIRKVWYSGKAVSSGAARTEMLIDVLGSDEALERMGAIQPVGRIGRPEEIADPVVWLFSLSGHRIRPASR